MMIKKPIYILLVLLLVSCGNTNTADLGGAAKGVTAAKTTVSPPDASLRTILSRAENGGYMQGELLVKYKTGVTASSSLRTNRSVGAALIRKISGARNVQQVKLPAGMPVTDAIVKYMSDPGVEYAEPNYIRYPKNTIPSDTFFDPQQWALRNTGTFAGGTEGADIDMPGAWDITQGSRDIVVAVIDSGVDLNHPDLVSNIWRNPGEASCVDGVDNEGNGFIDDCVGWNFVDDDNSPMDDLGHGTHVSGIIGAVGNNATGIAGVMWNVSILPLKFITDLGPGVCGPGVNFCGTVADEAAAIDYAVQNGAKIINASYGSSEFAQTEYDAINAANAAGVLFIAAAGNGGLDSAGDNNDLNPSYPAAINLPNVIAVAATDQNDNRASFSNYGPVSVHVAAPGVYVLSSVPLTGVSMSFSSFCTGSAVAAYDFCSGTSMAAPHVAGLAGLLESYYTGFTPAQIRATILRYVDQRASLLGWIQTGGRINAYKALTSLLPPSDLVAEPVNTGVELTWADNATGEDGYTVERKTGSGAFAGIATLGPDSTSYKDTAVSASTTYTYRVRAFNTIPATSAWVESAAVTTSEDLSPTTGGAGGGCTVGGPQNFASGAANTAVLLMPLLALMIARNLRRRKK
jgi:subtilisin family serine protease